MINSVDAAIELLIKYKETVLEGYVSEYLFEKQFLDSSNREYAHGIWTAKWGGLHLFFIFKQELSDIDKKILSNKLSGNFFFAFLNSIVVPSPFSIIFNKLLGNNSSIAYLLYYIIS